MTQWGVARRSIRRKAGPGIAKTRPRPLMVRRTHAGGAAGCDPRFVALRPAWFRLLLAQSDIASEGAIENGTYFGSTNIRCPLERLAVAALPETMRSAPHLTALVLADGHARVGLLRLARREAMRRAACELDVLHADLTARTINADDYNGRAVFLSIEIDVSAPLRGARTAIG